MFGFLNVNKPTGVTSRGVVNVVQRLVRPAKVGHAGTLDPLASGVLVVCIGPATRLMEYVQRMPKHYVGTFILGQRSTTEDIEGDIELLTSSPTPSVEQVRNVLPRFLGEIQQTPPSFSALKLKGMRAYDLARQGATVELAPRPVMIHELVLVQYEYPHLTLDIRCGSGTYVRSLGRDIARALGTEAVMLALERRAIGGFRVEEAVNLEKLTKENLASHLHLPKSAVAELPSVVLDPEEVEHVRHGRSIHNRFEIVMPESAAFTPDGRLAAILRIEGAKLHPTLCFLNSA